MRKITDIMLFILVSTTLYLLGSSLGVQMAEDSLKVAAQDHYDYERMVCVNEI